MKSIQINKVLTKHVKYFQGVYPKALLPSTLMNISVIFFNPYKHYMPSSHWVVVWFPDSSYAEYFNSYVPPPYNIEVMAFLHVHWNSWTFNRHRLRGIASNSAVVPVTSTPSTEPGDYTWRNSWSCLYLVATPAKIKGSTRVPRSVRWVSRFAASWSSSSSRASRRHK